MPHGSNQIVISIAVPLLLGFLSNVFGSEEDESSVYALPMREVTAEDLEITPEDLEWIASNASLTTSSTTYDSTLLEKYIPGRAFVPLSDPSGGADDDAFQTINGSCISPHSASQGNDSLGYATIELPGNALLVDAIVHAYDADEEENITVSINHVNMNYQTIFNPAPTPPTTTWSLGDAGTLVSGSSSGNPGWTTYVLDPEDTVTGFVSTGLQSGAYRFFVARVAMDIAAGDDLRLCGLRVRYRVPTTGDNQAFTPLAPCNFYDSRPTNGGSGIFAANEIRTIVVSGDSSSQGGDGDCGVPFSATAVQVNAVVVDPVGTGSLKLWAPSDPEPAGLMAYTTALPFWNGSSTVPVSTSGAGTGSGKKMNVKTNFQGAHVFLTVTGYYSAVSNMGN